MKGRCFVITVLAATALTLVSCYHPYGSKLYPDAPRFAATKPADVELLRREPRRDHVRLGEVWIEPERDMSRDYVEKILREKTAAMGGNALVIVVDRFYREAVVYNYWGGRVAVVARRIVGVAVHYK